MSAIRGIGFGLGGAYLFGARFGIAFGALSTVGQVIAYRFGVRPTVDYQPAKRPRLTRFQLIASANRAVGYAVAGYVSSLIAGHRDDAVALGLRTGLTVGLVTVLAIPCTPFIEWEADHLPARRMGVFGVGLILTGFALQSTQYWAVLLDITVR